MVFTLSWLAPQPPRQASWKAVLQSEGGGLRKQHLKKTGEHNNDFVVYKTGGICQNRGGGGVDEKMLEVFLHQAVTSNMSSSPSIHLKDSA